MTKGTLVLASLAALWISTNPHVEKLFDVHSWPWILFMVSRACLMGVSFIALWQLRSIVNEEPKS